uniref:Uncharacterized protein n=1 Tax=Strigamia maritima TaxID=126957 RepID=T1J7K0_STRMM
MRKANPCYLWQDGVHCRRRHQWAQKESPSPNSHRPRLLLLLRPLRPPQQPPAQQPPPPLLPLLPLLPLPPGLIYSADP